MEVVHVDETVKHVVIGGGATHRFGIANTAEFVTILSDSLYSNKKLAFIREVMCNAWDAHIANDITDQAIKVTFKENSIIIRDFGTGIPDNMIADIYCMYGESTKRNESATTGGFGLGSKSPFAVSDTFMVTSFHEGTQTVYAVSKGTDETDGLPALRVMVTLPTDQHGMLVEVPMMDRDDMSDCLHYAQTVALYGEMRAEIDWMGADNITVLPTDLGLKDSKLNYMLTSRDMGYEQSTSSYQRIYVQYGAVVYPVSDNKAYAEAYKELNYRLGHMSRTSTIPLIRQPVLLIRAEPDSLSVNPSREVLSYSSHTVKTLKATLEAINAQFNEVRPDFIKHNLDLALAQHIKVLSFDKLNNMVDVMRFCKSIDQLQAGTTRTVHTNALTTLHDIHANFLIGQYKTQEFSKYTHKQAYRHVQSFREGRWNKLAKELIFGRKRHDRFFKHNLRKYILRDILLKAGKEYLQLHQFMCLSYRSMKPLPSAIDKRYGHINGHWDEYNPFQVIVVYNRNSLNKFVEYYNIQGSNQDRNIHATNVISVPRIKKTLSADFISDTLESMGYEVQRVYDDPLFSPPPMVRAPVKRAKKLAGYPLARDCLDTDGRFDYNMAANAGRIAKPTTHIIVKQRSGVKILPAFRAGTLAQFLEFYPDTVVVATETTATKLENAGSLDVSAAMKVLIDTKFSDPAFIKAIAYSRGPLMDDSRYYRYLIQIPEIKQEYGLTDVSAISFDKEEKLYEFLRFYSHYTQDSELNDKVNAERQLLSNLLPNKKLIEDREHYLDWVYNIIRNMDDRKGNNRRVALELIRTALKG